MCLRSTHCCLLQSIIVSSMLLAAFASADPSRSSAFAQEHAGTLAPFQIKHSLHLAFQGEQPNPQEASQ